jgi:hypothetical protein
LREPGIHHHDREYRFPTAATRLEWSANVRFGAHSGLGPDIAAFPKSANFSREPPFLLRGLSYMRELPPERADGPKDRIGGGVGGGGG